MSDTNEIEFIVEKLNEHLNLNLTIVAFDELSSDPQKLLQLFNDVLCLLHDRHKVDLSQEPQEQTVKRILDFLIQILGMKHLKDEDDFVLGSGILQGKRNVIYPILYDIFSRFQDLKTRVYLSKFLVEIYVPQEFVQADEGYYVNL